MDAIDFEREVLVHIHIPKTGGSTLFERLREHFSTREVVGLGQAKVDNFRRTRLEERFFDLYFAARGLKSRLLNRHHLAPQDMTLAELRRAKAFGGHVRVGDEPETGRTPRYVALVREPYDRFVSGFYFGIDRDKRGVRSSSRSIFHDQEKGAPKDLAEYLSRLEATTAQYWRNPQTRYFARSGLFEDAKRVIEQHDIFVAPLSRSAEFGSALSEMVGVEIDMERRANRSESRIGADEGDAELRRRAMVHFDEDRKLHDYVAARFGG